MYSQSTNSYEILKIEKSKWTTGSSNLCLYIEDRKVPWTGDTHSLPKGSKIQEPSESGLMTLKVAGETIAPVATELPSGPDAAHACEASQSIRAYSPWRNHTGGIASIRKAMLLQTPSPPRVTSRRLKQASLRQEPVKSNIALASSCFHVNAETKVQPCFDNQ